MDHKLGFDRVATALFGPPVEPSPSPFAEQRKLLEEQIEMIRECHSFKVMPVDGWPEGIVGVLPPGASMPVPMRSFDFANEPNPRFMDGVAGPEEVQILYLTEQNA